MGHVMLQMKTVVVILFILSTLALESRASTNDSSSKYQEYKTGNSKRKVDWFAYIKLFIDIILPDDLTAVLIDYVEPIIRNMSNSDTDGKFDVEKVKEMAIKIGELEAATCIVIGFSLIVALILPFFCLGCCCSCCCCTPRGASPKKRCSRRFLIFFLVVCLLITLPAVAYLYFSSHKLNGLTDNVINRVDFFIDDAFTFIDNTRLQTVDAADEPFQKMTADIFSELDASKEYLVNQTENTLMEKLKLEKLIPIRNSDASKATSDLKEVNVMWKSPKFKELLGHVAKFKTDVQNTYCTTSGNDCATSGVTAALDNLPTTCNQDDYLETSITKVEDMKNQLDIDSYIVEINKSFKVIPDDIKLKYDDAIDDFKKNIDKLKDGLNNLTQQLGSFTDKLNDFKAEKSTKLREYNSSIDKFNQYTSYVTLGISSYIFSIWILFCGGLFIGAVFHNKSHYPSERSCGSNTGGCILMTTIIVMLSTASVFWILNSILFPVGSHVHEYICKPLYDEPKFTHIRRLIDIIPFNDSVITDAIPSIKSKNEILDILTQCQEDAPVFKAFHLESFVKLEEIMDIKKYIDIRQELEKLTNMDLTKFTNEFMKKAKELETELVNPKSVLDGVIQDKTINDCLGINKKVEEVTVLMSTSDIVNDINVKLMESKANPVIAKGLKDWSEFRNFRERLNLKINDMQQLISDLSNNILKSEAEKLANKILDHGQEFVNAVIFVIKNKIGGCRPVWNIFDTSRAIVCKDIVDPINGVWFSLGFCLFIFLPTSIIACCLSKHFRRLPNEGSSRSSSFAEDEVSKGHYYEDLRKENYYYPR